MRQPDVLEVDHDHVHVLEHAGGGLARLGVERVDGQTGRAVRGVSGLDHVVLHVAPDAVLGPEERGEADVGMGVHEIGRVPKRMVDGGLVADEADALSAEQVAPLAASSRSSPSTTGTGLDFIGAPPSPGPADPSASVSGSRGARAGGQEEDGGGQGERARQRRPFRTAEAGEEPGDGGARRPGSEAASGHSQGRSPARTSRRRSCAAATQHPA